MRRRSSTWPGESADEGGGERDGGVVFYQQREPFAELDVEAGPELAREIDFDEADAGASEPAGWSGPWFGHPGKDARSAADW